MTIGERIRAERRAKGMTQHSLAKACGTYASAIRKYESGKITPKTETLLKIAEAIGADDPLKAVFEWWREEWHGQKEAAP